MYISLEFAKIVHSYQCVCVCVLYSAFDTLAKVLNPSEAGLRQILADKLQCLGGATIQLIGRDQETPIIEVEGPLLTDSHVSFKVCGVTFIELAFQIVEMHIISLCPKIVANLPWNSVSTFIDL